MDSTEASQPSLEALAPELARLREDNQRLSDQVKRLVTTESDLYEIQEQLDGQMRIYRRLFEIGKEFNAAAGLEDVLKAITEFILYDLEFERCLVFLQDKAENRFVISAMDGYFDDASEKNPSQEILLGNSILPVLLTKSEYLVCTLSSDQAQLVSLRQDLQMDEFVVFPLKGEGTLPNGLLIAGTRAERTEFHTRVQDNSESVLGLGNLASQASTAINNVKFYEALERERQLLEEKVEARTRELARTVDELKALAEVGQTVTSTLDLQQVLTTIVTQADKLSGTDGGTIYEYDAATQTFILRAAQKFPKELIRALKERPLDLQEGAVGRAARLRQVVEVPDLMEGDPYPPDVKRALIESGFRGVLAVPLVREDQIIGGLVLCRKSPGEFPTHVLELVRTFASQSALAIQNARLFKEIENKGLELENVSRHKSEFLANMSHELRTPLNAIIGFSEVLLEKLFGDLNEKQEEYLTDVLTSGQHLLSLINDILDLSKVEAGHVDLDVRLFSLNEALESSLTMVRERAANHRIQIKLEIPGEVEIEADERRVKQIVANLLSNAVKFTGDGGNISLIVRLFPPAETNGATTESESVGRPLVEISVSDTGIGISAAEQDKVFEEFQQAGQPAEVAREGTGLGLSLARRLVELHGGRMWLTSEIGVGSTFSFTLPVSQSAHSPSPPLDAELEARYHSGSDRSTLEKFRDG